MKAPEIREPQIFILDANPAILEYLQHILADRFSVCLFTRAEELIRSLSQPNNAELLLIDWRTPDNDNERGAHELLSQIRLAKPSLPIIILACSTYLKEAVTCARAGADDVILKPFQKRDIETVVQKYFARPGKIDNSEDNEAREIPLDENVSFVLACKRMREIESQCRLVARADIPILILGESGT